MDKKLLLSSLFLVTQLSVFLAPLASSATRETIPIIDDLPYVSYEERRKIIKEYYEGLSDEQIKLKTNYFRKHEKDHIRQYMTEEEKKKYHFNALMFHGIF